ncbi:MAG: helix-turn-helix domain-containing protein [Patescibacteria group bacterium]|nr:helix-turn-helix domain-containing protein [Patescibacteria group bacterium]
MFSAISTLEESGFSHNESLVYIALLESGTTNAGSLIKKTGLHRQIVYQALGSLESKGYVIPSTKKGKKHFQAASPEGIIRAQEERTERVRSVLPELLALKARSLDAVEVRTLYGHEGFVSNLKDVIESAARTDRTMRIIGGAPDKYFYSMIGGWYDDYVALLQKNHVVKKLISPESYSSEFKKNFALEKGNELRTMAFGLSSPTYTRITPELMTMEIYIEGRDMTIIQIRNKAIAQGYLEHFNLLWGQAKEYIPVK